MEKRRSIGQIKKEVENYKKSGVSKKDYCQKHGISLNSLNWIIIRLQRHEKSKKEKSKVMKSGFTCFELKKPVETKPIMVHCEKIKIELPENFSEQSFKKILTIIKSWHV
ncbi:hypothetical protein KAJ27_05045 [bacterium]|nr:hypothetical protein [bacterium]